MPRFRTGTRTKQNQLYYYNNLILCENYLPCEVVLLQLLEYPESDIFVLLVPDSDSIFKVNQARDLPNCLKINMYNF